jgi:ABC-type polysaccharide/polyol phosphate export permease
VSALPAWIQPLSEILPVTHGLRVLRYLALGGPDPGVSASLAAEIAIGLAFLGLSFLSFRYFLREARIAGTLDFH